MKKDTNRNPEITIIGLKAEENEYIKLKKIEITDDMKCLKIIKVYNNNGNNYILQRDYCYMNIDFRNEDKVEVEVGTVNSKTDVFSALTDAPRDSRNFNYDIRKIRMDRNINNITEMITSFITTDNIEKYLDSMTDRKCQKCYVRKDGIYNN